MSKIDETLRRIAAGTPKASTPISSSTNPPSSSNIQRTGYPGDPDCPICAGLGYIRQEVPVNHPAFGKLELCECRSAQATREIHNRLFSMSNLEELRHLTFDSFKPRGHVGLAPFQADSLERALFQAKHFANKLEGWLLLQGTFGCGKTHLASAIANQCVSLGVATLFITVPDMLDALRSSYSSGDTSFEDRFDQIRRVTLLILDDFGTQNATSWAQEKLFQILNFRYINRLPLVITTNLDQAQINDRIWSRLQDPELVARVKIQAPDYRNPTNDTIGSERLSLGHLPPNRSFATFDFREDEGLTNALQATLQKVFNAARDFAGSPQGWLVILGDEGCGKTHLAVSIANYRSELGLPYVFVSVPEMLNYLRATFSPNSNVNFDQRYEEIRTSSLLILEDLGTQSSTPWAREQLYSLFNHRYNAELPTVITTADKLDDIDPRLRSRLLDRRFCRNVALENIPYYTGGKTKRTRSKRS